MSPVRARKALNLGKWFRVNFTLRSVTDFLRDWSDDGHLTPGRRPWSSWTVGPRGFTWNSARRTARVDLPGPLSYETDPFPRDPEDAAHNGWHASPERWTDTAGRRFERTPNVTGGTTTRYLPDPVTDADAILEPCPRCGAEPGGRCRTPRGASTEPHLPRVELARANRAHPAPPAGPGGEVPPWGTPPR